MLAGVGPEDHAMVHRLLDWIRRRRITTGCLVCGICCEYYAETLEAGPEDLRRWRAEGRDDLLSLVGREGDLWVDPATGERLASCPFLQRLGPDRAVCGIHETKPQVCAAYPTPYHGFRCLRGVSFPYRRFESSAL